MAPKLNIANEIKSVFVANYTIGAMFMKMISVYQFSINIFSGNSIRIWAM